MSLVAGVDSSTQSVKVTIRDAASGEEVRSGRAAHPDGTHVDPRVWWDALQSAIESAGGLSDVAALAVGAQQHGMVALDAAGDPVFDALLWNDTRSAPDAEELVRDRGAQWWADQTGSLPVASFTVTKLAWLARVHPELAARVEQVMLPHDYLTWRLRSGGEATTDRGDASGTGYFSPSSNEYLPDLVEQVMGRSVRLPRVLGPSESPGAADGIVLGPGTGDNMAAALGVGAGTGDVVVSIGTSGTVFASSAVATADPSGIIAGFADALGGYLPLVCTLNASRVLDAACSVLGVDYAELDRLAVSVPDAGGLVLLPYLEGERTPNLPTATGSLHGITRANSTPAHYARAAVEGMVCGLAAGLTALQEAGVACRRVLLVGGGAQSSAVGQIAAEVFGVPVVVPAPGEYVAAGAARQAAWALTGELPRWDSAQARSVEAQSASEILARFNEVQARVWG
ncbi:MAG: xylulokinase [Actinobacteria bacterium]|nr:MAG: xylulokinase [Actinomycetota bacterium]